MNLAERVRPSSLVKRSDQVQTRGCVVRVDAGREGRAQATRSSCITVRTRISIAGLGFTEALYRSNTVACVVRIAVGTQKAELLQTSTVRQTIPAQRAGLDADEELGIVVKRLLLESGRFPASKPDGNNHERTCCKQHDEAPESDSRNTRHAGPIPAAMKRMTTGPRSKTITHKKINVIGPRSMIAASDAVSSAATLRRKRCVCA